MDRQTFQLAESFETFRDKLTKATRTRLAAVEAEQKRRVKADAEIEALAVAEREAQNALGRSGAARGSIVANLPADIAQALDKARAELLPHQESLENAKRALATQKAHHDESYPKLDLKTRGGKVDLEELERHLVAAKNRVTEEEDRCRKIGEALKRHEKARDAWLAEARAAAFATKAEAEHETAQ